VQARCKGEHRHDTEGTEDGTDERGAHRHRCAPSAGLECHAPADRRRRGEGAEHRGWDREAACRGSETGCARCASGDAYRCERGNQHDERHHGQAAEAEHRPVESKTRIRLGAAGDAERQEPGREGSTEDGDRRAATRHRHGRARRGRDTLGAAHP
jgi:hypothetical protein